MFLVGDLLCRGICGELDVVFCSGLFCIYEDGAQGGIVVGDGTGGDGGEFGACDGGRQSGKLAG